MNLITYDKFCEFVEKNITDQDEAQKIVREYLLNDFEGSQGEFVGSLVEECVLEGDSDNLFIPNRNIYISIKKLTVLILACICDIFVTKGAVTALGVALGKINTCIYKLEKDDCCVFGRILYYSIMRKNVSIDELVSDYSAQCFNEKRVECAFWKQNGICKMTEYDIKLAVDKLVRNGVINKHGKLIKLS